MLQNRIKFEKGKQREFIGKVLEKMNCPSLKDLLSYDPEFSYSCLKKYHQERCCLPEPLFSELCVLSGIKKNDFKFEVLPGNWGNVRGGKKGYRKMIEKNKQKLRLWRRSGGKNRWKKR